MVRAGIKALLPGGRLTGASTITQQACRNLLLSQERTLGRKIREWILTPRMEQALTKDQILNLYLNQIYFGHNRYGVEEAALYYFGKHAKELSVGEAAVLAGHVQLPDRINPVTNMVRAKKRQRYVLGQMAEARAAAGPRGRGGGEGADRARSAAAAPRWARTTSRRSAGCWSPATATRWCSPAACGWTSRWTRSSRRSPTSALREGLEALDRRMGYRGALGEVDPQALRAAADPPREAHRGGRPAAARRARCVADLSRLAQAKPAVGRGGRGRRGAAGDQRRGRGRASSDEVLVRARAARPARRRACASAATSPRWTMRTRRPRVDLVGPHRRMLAFATVAWARPRGRGQVDAGPGEDLGRAEAGPAGAGAHPRACPPAAAAGGHAGPGARGAGGARRSSTPPPRTWWP